MKKSFLFDNTTFRLPSFDKRLSDQQILDLITTHACMMWNTNKKEPWKEETLTTDILIRDMEYLLYLYPKSQDATVRLNLYLLCVALKAKLKQVDQTFSRINYRKYRNMMQFLQDNYKLKLSNTSLCLLANDVLDRLNVSLPLILKGEYCTDICHILSQIPTSLGILNDAQIAYHLAENYA